MLCRWIQPREAHGQRLHRGSQRTLPPGVPERELVPVPGEDTTMVRDPTGPWETCLPGNLLRWQQWLIDPQNSHYAWYRKWGKTIVRNPNLDPGSAFWGQAKWTADLASERLTGALLDRLTHHVHILEINGESYRLKRSKENTGSLRSGEPDDV